MMHHDPRSMIAAVARAAGHEPDVKKFDDRLTMQKGCYILNCWDYGPKYSFSLYIHGPYSSELADDYYELGAFSDGETDIPDEIIEKLRDIFNDGLGYVEAYATVLLVKNNSPGASSDRICERSIEIKPHLEKEVKKAAACLLN